MEYRAPSAGFRRELSFAEVQPFSARICPRIGRANQAQTESITLSPSTPIMITFPFCTTAFPHGAQQLWQAVNERQGFSRSKTVCLVLCDRDRDAGDFDAVVQKKPHRDVFSDAVHRMAQTRGF